MNQSIQTIGKGSNLVNVKAEQFTTVVPLLLSNIQADNLPLAKLDFLYYCHQRNLIFHYSNILLINNLKEKTKTQCVRKILLIKSVFV